MRMKMRDGFREIGAMAEAMGSEYFTLDKTIASNGVCYRGYICGSPNAMHVMSDEKKSVRGVVNQMRRMVKAAGYDVRPVTEVNALEFTGSNEQEETL